MSEFHLINQLNDSYTSFVKEIKRNKKSLSNTMDLYHSLYLSFEQINTEIIQSCEKSQKITKEHTLSCPEINSYFSDFAGKLNHLNEQSKKNDITMQSKLYDSICQNYDTCIGQLKQVIFSLNESHKLTDKYKASYFEVTGKIEIIKSEMGKVKSGSAKYKDYIEQQNDLFSKSQILTDLIKIEIKKANQIIEECKTKYSSICKTLKSTNEKKKNLQIGFDLNFAAFSIDIGNLFINLGNELNKNVKRSIQDKTLAEKELTLPTVEFNIESFDSLSKEAKIKAEELAHKENLDKETYLDDICDIVSICSESNLLLDKTEASNSVYSLNDRHMLNLQIDSQKYKDVIISEEEQNVRIKQTFEKFLSIEEIDYESVNRTINSFFLNKQSSNVFCNFITSLKSNEYIQFKNYNNLLYFATVLNIISLNKRNDPEHHYKVMAVIYISERTYFDNGESKIFLCHILSRNKIYSSKTFWKEIFDIEYNSSIQKHYIKIYPTLLKQIYGGDLEMDSKGKLYLINNLTKLRSETDVLFKTKASVLMVDTKMLNNQKMSFLYIRDAFLDNNGMNKAKDKDKDFKKKTTTDVKKLQVFHQKNSIFQSFSYLNKDQLGFDNFSTDDVNKLQFSHEYLEENLSLILKYPTQAQNSLINNANYEEASLILKGIISHFANFNFDVSEAIEYIFEISEKINFNKDYISLLVSLVNTSSFTVKNKNSKMYKRQSINSNTTSFKSNDYLSFILSSSYSYLSLPQSLCLRELNSAINKKISSQLFSALFKQSLDKVYHEIMADSINNDTIATLMQKRLNYWGIISMIRKTKQTYNYSSLLEQVKFINDNTKLFVHKSKRCSQISQIDEEESESRSRSEIDNSEVSEVIDNRQSIISHLSNISKMRISDLNLSDIYENFSTIKMDTVRTYFKHNQEENRKALSNILMAHVISQNKKSYTQGMNYIVCFLLELNDYKEEDTFFLFNSIYDNTSFNLIFDDEMLKLRQFFYAFDRILSLYCPEINSSLFHNNIGSSYYCSSWFTTLFTNCAETKEKKTSLVVLKIWDEFLINGWYALIKTALIMFLTYEKKILSLSNEEILNFLFNSMHKLGFFENENYHSFCDLWEKVNLPKDLLSNLENEFTQGEKIRDKAEILQIMLDR